VRTVTLHNLVLTVIQVVHMLVLFRLLLTLLALIEDSKFISVYRYKWKSSWSLTIFHHVLVLLLSYNCDWGTLPFNKSPSIGSYDFVIAVKIEKNSWPIFGILCKSLALIWLFSGLHLALGKT